jgi:hypothetical protein
MLTKQHIERIYEVSATILLYIALIFFGIAIVSLIVGLWVWTFDVDANIWVYGKIFLSSLTTAIISMVVGFGVFGAYKKL